jgi:hypothetical protein
MLANYVQRISEFDRAPPIKSFIMSEFESVFKVLYSPWVSIGPWSMPVLVWTRSWQGMSQFSWPERI